MPQGDTHDAVWWRSAADETLDLPLLAVQGVLGLRAGDDGRPCGDRRGCWHPMGLGGWGVRAAPDEYWGPALKGRDGETAPSPPVMESIEWRLWVFAKSPQSTRVPDLCTPIPVGKDPAPISLVTWPLRRAVFCRSKAGSHPTCCSPSVLSQIH